MYRFSNDAAFLHVARIHTFPSRLAARGAHRIARPHTRPVSDERRGRLPSQSRDVVAAAAMRAHAARASPRPRARPDASLARLSDPIFRRRRRRASPPRFPRTPRSRRPPPGAATPSPHTPSPPRALLPGRAGRARRGAIVPVLAHSCASARLVPAEVAKTRAPRREIVTVSPSRLAGVRQVHRRGGCQGPQQGFVEQARASRAVKAGRSANRPDIARGLWSSPPQDDVPAFPSSEAFAIMERSCRPLNEVFSVICNARRRRVARPGVRAPARDREEVAVKVQRPASSR